MNSELYAILIPGPDDVIAMASKEAADSAARVHNEIVDGDDWPLPERRNAYRALVILWPHDAASHAAELNRKSEIKVYSDGTIVTGLAPLPELSPRQQDTKDALGLLDDIESVIGGSNGPSIRLRALVERLGA